MSHHHHHDHHPPRPDDADDPACPPGVKPEVDTQCRKQGLVWFPKGAFYSRPATTGQTWEEVQAEVVAGGRYIYNPAPDGIRASGPDD